MSTQVLIKRIESKSRVCSFFFVEEADPRTLSKADWIRIRVERADHWVRFAKMQIDKNGSGYQHPVMKSEEDSRLPLAR
jgi:hypothetical protein